MSAVGRNRYSGAVYVYKFSSGGNSGRLLQEEESYDFILESELIDSYDNGAQTGDDLALTSNDTLIVSGSNRDLIGTVYEAQLFNNDDNGTITTTISPTLTPSYSLIPATLTPTSQPVVEQTSRAGAACIMKTLNDTKCIGSD